MEKITHSQELELVALVIIILFVAAVLSVRLVYRKMKQDECPHLHVFTHVQNAVATCEEVHETCIDCGLTLKHKTDCR